MTKDHWDGHERRSLDSLAEHVDARIDKHADDEMERYGKIEERLGEIEKSLHELVEIWTQTKGVMFFLKWAAGISTALVGLAMWAKEHIK